MSTALLAMAGVVILGMLLRMPIGFSMLMSGVAYLWVKGQDLGLVAEQVGNGLYNSYVLLAVPMFVFAANLMNAGTVSERIFDFCRVLVGRMRGGLAQVDILVSVIFSGMSGSAIADAAGPGLVTIRQMLARIHTWLCRGSGGGQRHLGPHHPPLHSHGDLRPGFRRIGGGFVLGWLVAWAVHDAVDDGGGAFHRHAAQHAP